MNRRRLPKEELAARAAGRTRRVLVSLARAVAAFGLAAGVLYGSVVLLNAVRTGGRFTVKHVVFAGNQRATADELLARAGMLQGVNIFGVDLAAASRAMEGHPWVAHAHMARDFPDTLRVTVEERTAAALLSENGLWAIDNSGLRFKAVTAADHLDLPIVSAASRELLTNGDDSANSAILTSLQIIDAYGARKVALQEPLSEVRIIEEAGEPAFDLFCGDGAVEVKLGVLRGDVRTELKGLFDRLERVWGELEQRGARPHSIDLGNRLRPDWIAVRLEAAASSSGTGSTKR